MSQGEQTASEISRPAWLHSIDGARGIAAVMVMFFHSLVFIRGAGAPTYWYGEYVELYGPDNVFSSLLYSVFGLGFLGVPLFFVISGFCIHLPFAGGRGTLELKSFASRRFLRLYPAYAVTCIVCFIILAVNTPYGEQGLTLGNMIGHVFFWHYSIPLQTHGSEVTLVLWTIVLEVHFYILYALLFPWLRRFGVARMTAVALGVGVAYRLYWELSGLGDQDLLQLVLPSRFALARFGEWLLGAWLAERYVRSGSLFPSWPVFATGARSFATGIGFGGLAIVSVTLAEAPMYWLQIPITIAFAIALGGLIMSEQRSRSESDNQTGSRIRSIMKWLGDRSYSLYLIHYITLHVVHFVGRQVAARFGLSYEPMTGTVFAVTMIAIFTCLIVAHLLYVFVEAPSHRLARKTRAGTT
jgi:peptidoglycan/LPS O-acetylase OafA/YrhL